MRFGIFLVATLLLAILSTGQGYAANAVARAGNTLQLGSVTYRPHGMP